MKFSSVEKQCPVAILFVNISLVTVKSSTVTSSKLNVENSTKAQYVNETRSYRLLKFEINKSKNFMKTKLNHGKLCKTISKYIMKRLLHLYGNILYLTRSFGVVAKRTRLTQYIQIQVQ